MFFFLFALIAYLIYGIFDRYESFFAILSYASHNSFFLALNYYIALMIPIFYILYFLTFGNGLYRSYLPCLVPLVISIVSGSVYLSGGDYLGGVLIFSGFTYQVLCSYRMTSAAKYSKGQKCGADAIGV